MKLDKRFYNTYIPLISVVSMVLFKYLTASLEFNINDLNITPDIFTLCQSRIEFIKKTLYILVFLAPLSLLPFFYSIIDKKIKKSYPKDKILYTYRYRAGIFAGIILNLLAATIINNSIVPFLIFYNYLSIDKTQIICCIVLILLATYLFYFSAILGSASYLLTDKRIISATVQYKEKSLLHKDIETIDKEKILYNIGLYCINKDSNTKLQIGFYPFANKFYKKLIELVNKERVLNE